jgi:peptidoglycan/LPS O-acetylase OafA/YrhL
MFGMVWLAALLGLSTLVWKFYEIPAQKGFRALCETKFDAVKKWQWFFAKIVRKTKN